jgi:cytidine kinase
VRLVAFGIILDTLVYADGRQVSSVLGGGGPQAAFGMRLWSDEVGLVARVGHDLPSEVWAWLKASGIDTDGVRQGPWPTLRARQHLDRNGGRRHEWLVPAPAIRAQLARRIDDLPSAYRAAHGWHLGLHLETPDLGFLAALRVMGGTVSVEPFRPAERPLPAADLRALLGACHVFSPNLVEAASLVGPGAPDNLAARLAAQGAGVLALRMGARGALVGSAAGYHHIPAVNVAVRDPVGAGNAFCGGLLAGWVETTDVVEAGLRGAVAASFALEQIGLPAVTPSLLAAARRRLAALRPQVRPVG